jgi:hypothetical protein
MTEYAKGTNPGSRRLLARGLATAALTGVALIHLAQLPDTWREMPALGMMFAVLAVAATAMSAALVHADTRRRWHGAALIGVAPIVGYVVTRSTAVPFDRGDVGNWLEPLGLVALFTEATIIALYGYSLWNASRDPARAGAPMVSASRMPATRLGRE